MVDVVDFAAVGVNLHPVFHGLINGVQNEVVVFHGLVVGELKLVARAVLVLIPAFKFVSLRRVGFGDGGIR